jgi:outer membrane putative beta-barrel porin/alpha-amylase
MRGPVIARVLRVLAVVAVVLAPTMAAAQIVPIAPYQTTARPTDPQQLQMPLRAPLTLLPSITISEEYNDNVLLTNRDRRSDFITGITPALNAIYESSTYRLSAGYNFTAEMYARSPDRNAAFNRQNFNLDTMWRPDEQLTLTLTDALAFSTDTNLISPEGVATGRDRAWSNSLAGGAAYLIDPFTTVRGTGSYTVQRFSNEDLRDSDVYRFDAGVDRALSRFLTGTVAYQFAYFDIDEEPKTWTHTPRLGVAYRLTERITVAASGGPTFEIREGDRGDRVTPAVTATYAQRVFFGTVGANFDRQVSTAGGLGGTADRTTFGVTVDVITLTRGLTLSFAPRYTMLESDDNRIDLRSITIPLTATYRFTAWLAAVASYQFYQQRTDSLARSRSGDLLAEDADQNRVFVGLQVGYPITFDRP